MIRCVPAAREPRAPHSTAANDATGANGDSELDAQQQAQEHALALQKAQFDFDAEERAELERERAALETMMMVQLKNEDEILKKWIELI